MKVIGLTGSIATGKSTVSNMLRLLGVPVFDADAFVHQLFSQDAHSFAEIKQAFPEAVDAEKINRAILGKIVFADDAKLKQLETILHPKVRAAELAFIKQNRIQHRALCALDIPLLFETKADALCDEVWVTYCPDFLQRQRIMAREGMSEAKCEQILARQMQQAQKLAQADRVLPTGIGKAVTMQILKQHISEIGDA